MKITVGIENMSESTTQRVLRRMFAPRPGWSQDLDTAYETIELQRRTIESQRAHIKALDARIEKLEREASGLRDLF